MDHMEYMELNMDYMENDMDHMEWNMDHIEWNMDYMEWDMDYMEWDMDYMEWDMDYMEWDIKDSIVFLIDNVDFEHFTKLKTELDALLSIKERHRMELWNLFLNFIFIL